MQCFSKTRRMSRRSQSNELARSGKHYHRACGIHAFLPYAIAVGVRAAAFREHEVPNMSYPHVPDEPIVPWWDDPRCEPDFEEERENAIERAVDRLLDKEAFGE